MHLDGDAVAARHLEVHVLARADLAAARDDAEGVGVPTAQRVGQPVAFRVHGGDGRADVDVRPRVLRHAALAFFAGREDGREVVAEDALGGNRFGALDTDAVVRIGDQRAQEESRVGPHNRVAGRGCARDVDPVRGTIAGSCPLPAFALNPAVAVRQGGLEQEADIVLLLGEGDHTLLLHVVDADGHQQRDIDRVVVDDVIVIVNALAVVQRGRKHQRSFSKFVVEFGDDRDLPAGWVNIEVRGVSLARHDAVRQGVPVAVGALQGVGQQPAGWSCRH